MFYLIDEKDGLFNQKILVNSNNLKSIETVTGQKFSVRFSHANEENLFVFEPKDIFDVDNVITEIAQQQPVTFKNDFIVVTDIENIQNISKLLGEFSPVINKASKILINIHDLGLVYEKEGKYIITTSGKNITIEESPELIYQQLMHKIIKPESSNDIKSQWKKSL